MIEIDRTYLGVMMEAGYILLGMQRYKESKEVFEGISVLAPDSEVPIVALGSIDFCLGKFKQAMKKYNKALKMNPDSLFAKAYLAESLFFSGDKKEALKILNQTNKEDPSGRAGDFARALLDAINKGFDPNTISGHEDVKKYVAKKKKTQK